MRSKLVIVATLIMAVLGGAAYAIADPPPPPGSSLTPPGVAPPSTPTPPPTVSSGPAPPVTAKVRGANSFNVAAGQVVCRRSHFTGLCDVAVSVCNYWADKYNSDWAHHRHHVALINHDVGNYNTTCPAIIEVKNNGGIVKLHPLPFLNQGAL